MRNTFNPTQAPMMQQQQSSHIVTTHSSPSQLIGSQRCFSSNETNALLHNPPTANNLTYFQQVRQNLSAPSIHQMHHQQQPQLHSHSIFATMGNAHHPTTALYDHRVNRLYATGEQSEPQLNTSPDTAFGSGSSQASSNTILINNFTQHQPELTQQQYFAQSHIVDPTATATTHQPSAMQLQLPTTQPFFLSTNDFRGGANTTKITNFLPPFVNTTLHSANEMQAQPITANATSTPAIVPATNSALLLDRINICINNHYTDSPPSSAGGTGTTGGILSTETPPLPSLPSPIIPAIQHRAIIDPSLLMESLTGSEETSAASSATTPVPPVISEPDSTTTSHTPPTTPESPYAVTSITIIQSPSTSTTATVENSLNRFPAESSAQIETEKEVSIIENVVTASIASLSQNSVTQIAQTEISSSESTPALVSSHLPPPPTPPPLPAPSTPTTPEISFSVGEDVFVRREDYRLYLGTIIDAKYQKYRVRFDDASEVWCSSKDMRKFGVSDDSTSSLNDKNNENESSPLCVACKQRDKHSVEICERCGRGYHHHCTTETTPDSGEWLCKRCSKPMKVKDTETSEYLRRTQQSRQLPYNVDSLNWDVKHRVNEEQIYCYCGKSGQFDQNMLQCCKCLNWYHTQCTGYAKIAMLRGDGFFVFSCAICSTNSKEFLRRLQLNRVDFMHLVLYNLSAQNKHHKYHHLMEDILPFVLKHTHSDALPVEWFQTPSDLLKEHIVSTLNKNTARFVCGREGKRDHNCYGLRVNGPPIVPKINVQKNDILTDKFLIKHMKLNLSKRALQNDCQDVDEHRIEHEEEDERFTSDDDIPIKHILEKKIQYKKDDYSNENSIECELSNLKTKEQRQDNDIEDSIEVNRKIAANSERSNHKRKAFTLSKPYKETAAAAAAKRYNSIRNCDSSSDENSSSSRGTSLDLIIPPPKDFLGLNNPFRIVTPKKNSNDKKSTTMFTRSNSSRGPAIKSSVVNTSAFDFSSKLAALKSAGIFPNLSTTNLAKAAGQPRMVRTIKRRLSAKDIMIGPNQEVRRRRTRRLSANVEVISTTTINTIPSNFFPMHAKDIFTTSSSMHMLTGKQTSTSLSSSSSPPESMSSSASSTLYRAQVETSTKVETQQVVKLATHGRRLRERPQKPSCSNSRRNSFSGASTSSSSSCNAIGATAYKEVTNLNDLHESVNKYFGAGNRLLSGEKFSLHAKRQLSNGQMQFLVEWGVDSEPSTSTSTKAETAENTSEICNAG